VRDWIERERERERERARMQARKDRRPQGLGVFNVLDDELLCGILNRLAPRTLGTLACVSR
jgi:hypothetical protein